MQSLNLFKALSDETRIRLLNILIHHELSVNELVSLLNMGQSRISRHLKILTDSQILECRRDGVWAFYSSIKNGPTQTFIDSVKYLFRNEETLRNDLVLAKKTAEERKQKGVRFFNDIAAEWDLLKQDILGQFDINKAILANIDNSDTAVDLGCGTGQLLSHLQEKAKKVIGVDSSSMMLEEAKKKFQASGTEADLRLGELEHLPLSNSEADLAVISMVLHHLDNPSSVISEVNRILAVGGKFIIADFDKHTNEAMRDMYGDRWLGFTTREIEQFLDSHGFRVEQTETHELKQSLKLNIYISVKTSDI